MDPKDVILYSLAALGSGVAIRQYIINPLLAKWRDRSGATKQLAEEIAALRKQMSGFELMPGLVKVCEAQVAEVAKLREAVTAFTKVVVREAASDEDILENYSETQADLAYARGQYMAQGYTPEEAEAKVDADESVSAVWSGTPGVE